MLELNNVINELSKDYDSYYVYYSAPGKSDFDIREAWDKSRIIVDSTGEIGLIEGIADEKGCSIDIGVRITRRTGRIFSQM